MLCSRISLATLAVLAFVSCEKSPAPETKPLQYQFSPERITKPPFTVVKPTPTPPVQKGWIEIQANRYQRAQIRPEKAHFVAAIANQIQRNKAQYQAVENATGVPWRIVGCLHSMEADLNFRCNLANGDSLMARTRHVPAGRPKTGTPPFQWTTAAIDALEFDSMQRKNWSDIGHSLQNTELYNGPFYENHGLISPYNHSWDVLYVRGKIVADGQYSSTAISQQCGVVPILKLLQ